MNDQTNCFNVYIIEYMCVYACLYVVKQKSSATIRHLFSPSNTFYKCNHYRFYYYGPKGKNDYLTNLPTSMRRFQYTEQKLKKKKKIATIEIFNSNMFCLIYFIRFRFIWVLIYM